MRSNLHILALLTLWLLAGCDSKPSTLVGGKVATIVSMSPLEVAGGDDIIVKGQYLAGDLNVKVGDKIVEVDLKNNTEAHFTLPAELPNGVFSVEFSEASSKLVDLPLFNKNSDYALPSSALTADKVCDTTIIKDASGVAQRGLRHCGDRPVCAKDGDYDCLVQTGGASAEVDSLPGKVMAGESIAGIEGTAIPNAGACQADGAGNCEVDGHTFTSVKMQNLTANDIRLGLTIAGLTGTMVGFPELCSFDNEVNCRANLHYPSIDLVNALTPALAAMRTTLTIGGLSGSIQTCAQDGETECVAIGPSYSAADMTGADTKILLGQTVASVDGTIAGRPSDCIADAQTACTTAALFPAVKKADLIAHAGLYQTSLSLAGLPGTLANCTGDGQSGCVTGTNYPALDKVGLQAKAPSYRSSVTFAGVTGSLVDCSTEGTAGCVTSAGYPAAEKALAASKILTGQSLAGITGTGVGRPADCASDGATDCTAVNAFPAMAKTGSASKILTGSSVGGVAGSAPIRPANCGVDGNTHCVAIATFPALDLNNLNFHLVNIKTGATIQSLVGQLPDCTDGDIGCFAEGPTFAAAEITDLGPKLSSGEVLAGVTGTGPMRPLDCASDGATDCVAVPAFPAGDASVIAFRTTDQSVLGGIQGYATIPRPIDCTYEGNISCVSTASFPAMKVDGAAPKISSGETLGGVTGQATSRPADCSSDGQTECLAVTAFPAINLTRLQTLLGKIRTNTFLAGTSGTLGNCSGSGATNCVTSASFPSMQVLGAAAKIVAGQTVGGVAGTGVQAPANCTASGRTDCVTTASYKSIDKATLTASPNKMKTTLTLLSVAGTLPDCSSDGATSCAAISAYPAAATTGVDAKILSQQTLAGVNGTAAIKAASCAADGATDCSTVASFPAVNSSLISAANIRRNTTLANVVGTLDDCAADGTSDCVAVASYPAALSNGSTAAKIMSGQVLAGVTGTTLPRPNDCSVDGGTDCVAVPSFPAIDTAALTAAASSIRSSATILTTTGSLADCTTDGQLTCVTASTFPAALASGAAAKIVAGNTVAGIAGSATARPSDCSSDGQSSCVTVTGYPSVNYSAIDVAKVRTGTSIAGKSGSLADCSADAQSGCVAVTAYPSLVKTNVTPGVIKAGSVLAGVTGQYPNATYLLPGATVAVTDDLTDSTDFNTRITSASPFEYYDSSGTRYTGTGDANLTADHVKSGTTIFGVAGTYAPAADCSTELATACAIPSGWKAAKVSSIESGKVRYGTTILGVAGANYFATNGYALATFNRIAGTDANTSTSTGDAYDSIDDNNNAGAFPAAAYATAGLPSPTNIWVRDSSTDTDSNGHCNGSETCIYLNVLSRLKWRFNITSADWATAAANCSAGATGGFDSGGRLPTQKEVMQASIDGIYSLSTEMGGTASSVWTATTFRESTASAWRTNVSKGTSTQLTKSSLNIYYCVVDY